MRLYSTFTKSVLVVLSILNNISAGLINSNHSKDNLIKYKGFLEVLRALDLLEQFPELSKIGICYFIDGVSVKRNQSNKLSIIVTMNINDSDRNQQKICSDSHFKKLPSDQSSLDNNNINITKVENGKSKNHASILAISQTIGIIICALLLGIFFFVAGIMRIKNFLRRNNSVFKLNGLRSCLTSVDESKDWRSSMTKEDLHQSTISNYLQLQSVIDKNVSQFMVRPNHYAKSIDLENKKPNLSVKRKLSLKNKLLPKRLNSNQSSQRRYSLTNEIESVMNKHFSMIGVTRKYGSKSTQNIGGQMMNQNSRLSQHSMLNELNFNYMHKNSTSNNVNDSSSMSSKSLLGRYQRYGNFPGRRATTIGGRSNSSRPKLSMKYVERDSPPLNTIYSSHHSVMAPQPSRHVPLKKQLTLQEGNEPQSYDYSMENQQLYTNTANKSFDKDDNEARYLKVPFKSLNLLPNKRCIFHLNDEKTSPSPESRESNSRCSSFDKASSTWSSLEIHEEPDNNNNKDY